MVALGKVRANLMIDLHASSSKLRDRATRVVAELTNCDYDTARQRLEAGGWDLRAVLKGL
jgi:N-acetylmuramic acid 6-phosphate etherase